MSLTKSQFHSFAVVCVGLSYADGDVDPSELGAFELAARDLGLAERDVDAVLDAAIGAVEAHSRDVDSLIAGECAKLPKATHAALFEAAAHTVFADGQLTDAECLRLAALRSFLGLSEAAAYAIVASVAHSEPELECRVSKSLMG